MAPGLTSKGGRLPDGEGEEGREFMEGDVVAVEAEGKQEVCVVFSFLSLVFYLRP